MIEGDHRVFIDSSHTPRVSSTGMEDLYLTAHGFDFRCSGVQAAAAAVGTARASIAIDPIARGACGGQLDRTHAQAHARTRRHARTGAWLTPIRPGRVRSSNYSLPLHGAPFVSNWFRSGCSAPFQALMCGHTHTRTHAHVAPEEHSLRTQADPIVYHATTSCATLRHVAPRCATLSHVVPRCAAGIGSG